MLACYPFEATQENWLHDALVSMIRDVHLRLGAGEAIVRDNAAWGIMVRQALNNEHQNSLVASTGIRDRLFLYIREIELLRPFERRDIFSIMEGQNRIAQLLNGVEDVENLEEQYPTVHVVVKDLFVFSYGKLTDFRVRERQYQSIFHSLATKICPFCGIERVMNPDETAQDQDHYLAKSIYPFAAANLRNLVPMCRCCNRDYKHDIDVIYGENDERRLAFDPYNCQTPSITLMQSTISDQVSPPLPEWEIDFLPASEQAETWDSVFQIRTRYKRDILNEYFDTYLKGFKAKCANDRIRRLIRADFSHDEVRNTLAFYQEDKAEAPSIGMAGFLEPLVFEFLLNLYDEGSQRIIDLIRDAVLGIQIEELT